METKEEYYTVKEIAEKLKVHQRTIKRWVNDSRIPYYSLNGVVRFNSRQIDGWLDKRNVNVKMY